MTQPDDLAAWLTQILDKDEARAAGPTFCGPVWPTTDQILARIAADRQILSRLRALEAESHEQWLDYADWIDGAHSREHRERQHTEQEIAEIPGLIYALKCSALPHADRPGYREEWRP